MLSEIVDECTSRMLRESIRPPRRMDVAEILAQPSAGLSHEPPPNLMAVFFGGCSATTVARSTMTMARFPALRQSLRDGRSWSGAKSVWIPKGPSIMAFFFRACVTSRAYV